MIRPVLLFLLCSMFLLGCEKDSVLDETPEIVASDALESTGILGNWEIQARMIGPISDMLPLCCEFIEFTADENLDDLKGTFEARANGEETNGTFELNLDNQTIFFAYNQKQRLDNYSVNDDQLSLQYDDNGSTVDETYVRRD